MNLYRYNKDKLQYEEVEIKTLTKPFVKCWSLVFGILFILAIAVGITTTTVFMSMSQYEEIKRGNDSIQAIQDSITAIELEEIAFTEAKLVNYLTNIQAQHIPVIVAQARLESSNYGSTIFNENNNMFGMKKCGKTRPTTHTGVNKGHATYDSWEDCVLDYIFWSQTYAKQYKSEKEYLAYLDNCYSAIGEEYSNRLRPIIKDVKSQYSLK